MMLKVDKFFIFELNKRGFNLSYNDILDIYRTSRDYPKCKAKTLANQRELAEFQEYLRQSAGCAD